MRPAAHKCKVVCLSQNAVVRQSRPTAFAGFQPITQFLRPRSESTLAWERVALVRNMIMNEHTAFRNCARHPADITH
jgi:hypothetical protein